MIVSQMSPDVVFVETTRSFILQYLWLIPAMPMLAAGLIALLKQPQKRAAASLAIGGLACSLLLAIGAFAHVLDRKSVV